MWLLFHRKNKYKINKTSPEIIDEINNRTDKIYNKDTFVKAIFQIRDILMEYKRACVMWRWWIIMFDKIRLKAALVEYKKCFV